jgi:hypothetical protein
MAAANMTLPEGDFLSAIHTSCHKVATNNTLLKVNYEKIKTYLDNLSAEKYEQTAKAGVIVLDRLDLQTFDSKVNAYSWTDLMQFGHGWRNELHDIPTFTPISYREIYEDSEENAIVYKGAAASIIDGIVNLYKNASLTPDKLKCLTVEQVAENFQLPLFKIVDDPENPGKTKQEVSPVRPYVEQIHSVLKETGEVLSAANYSNLADAVVNIATHAKDANGKPSAAKFVEGLVRMFPAFRDMGEANGEKVYVFKKAQLLASDLFLLFGKDPLHADLFGFVDLDHLSIFADNVVPAMMAHYQLLTLGKILNDKTVDGSDLTWPEALTLRAATIDLADEMVKAARSGNYDERIKSMNSGQLGYFFWKLGKEKELISLPRSSCRQTVFY